MAYLNPYISGFVGLLASFSGWCEPPPPDCSFARHLVGKMEFFSSNLLITKHSSAIMAYQNSLYNWVVSSPTYSK